MSDPRQDDILEMVSRGPRAFSKKEKTLIDSVVSDLNQGKIRVATYQKNEWVTHQWIVQALLLYLRSQVPVPIKVGSLRFFDRVPIKKWDRASGVRVIPPATVRYGAYIEPGAIIMPSFINVGASVGKGTMIDTWATVGTCAQVGRYVHISGGVGLGGVLEPLQDKPVIVEDDVFIGSRCVVVEGVRVEKGAVLGAGLILTASTKIIDVTGKNRKTWTGRVPENAVLIPGSDIKTFKAGKFAVNCALLIGYRSKSTDRKTSLNLALREHQISI